jgi:hypothetical protein
LGDFRSDSGGLSIDAGGTAESRRAADPEHSAAALRGNCSAGRRDEPVVTAVTATAAATMAVVVTAVVVTVAVHGRAVDESCWPARYLAGENAAHHPLRSRPGHPPGPAKTTTDLTTRSKFHQSSLMHTSGCGLREQYAS